MATPRAPALPADAHPLLHRVDPRRGLTEHDFTVIESWLVRAR
ncbi:hypothetical protein AB0B48_11585 [Micromonospora sp. NPDC049089]